MFHFIIWNKSKIVILWFCYRGRQDCGLDKLIAFNWAGRDRREMRESYRPPPGRLCGSGPGWCWSDTRTPRRQRRPHPWWPAATPPHSGPVALPAESPATNRQRSDRNRSNSATSSSLLTRCWPARQDWRG